MTSASELFYSRRSRLGRTDSELGSDPTLRRIFHHHRRHDSSRHHHHRLHRHDCDPLRRPHVRQSCLHDRASAHSVNSNTLNAEAQSSTSLNGNERLPGAVLLARARLVERLGGVSISGYRQRNRTSSEIPQRESALINDSSHVDSQDWPSFLTDLTSQTESFQYSREPVEKPRGLSPEALNRLKTQKFSCTEMVFETRDCSICLESFTEGEMLICLPCSHSFHSSCLDPWVRICGDCPYCRRAILLSSESL